jgi:coproporphyrinogen III oxidase-like Fe-S oxidoreductase
MPEDGSNKITREESVKEFIFLGLRKIEGISVSRAMSLGLNLPEAFEELIAGGFMETGRDSIRLTRKGLSISNTVIVRTFELLGL